MPQLKLKKCPFCKSLGITIVLDRQEDKWFAQCKRCNAKGPSSGGLWGDDFDGAVNGWNAYAENKANELLPCPLCGGDIYPSDSNPVLFVCDKCHTEFHIQVDTYEEAIVIWNKRLPYGMICYPPTDTTVLSIR